MALLAFVAAAAAVVLVLAVAGIGGSLALLLTGVAGGAVMLLAAWWFLSHRGVARWAAGCLAVLAPVVVAVLFARARLVGVVVVFGLLWWAAIAAARRALAVPVPEPVTERTAAPRHPYLIMNPRSGGGKVGRFRLAERARALGAEVFLLDGSTVDVAEVARRAVRDGADLLGVAGGDGTQALVAGVAAEHGVPFLVISAGTRNHFALDLGLDLTDPAAGLDALTDGEEVRVDLGRIGDRTFVNNASFGAYATVVHSPRYRDAKVGTALDLLPDALTGRSPLRLTVDGATLDGPHAVLISNNAYRLDSGQRPRLDRAELGVLAAGRRRVVVRTTRDAVVDADLPEIPVGVDGEALTFAPPVRCVTVPGALRVRVPRQRPGVPVPPPQLDWRRLRHLAFGRVTQALDGAAVSGEPLAA
ncbi:diacylglycerol kinase [Actinoplanes sp. SE50]|uniref:diacylglycerol/lipid kinase family protein n=1 Tax=unclassified Actinoplanes TaxID=2626549 RepID=UPI00023ED086|nr:MULTISPECIES: diacylglycerol kinase family protein [unclassified Actinoplanes]AEV84904.1 putative lipid kinase yegS-like protein [Actinoplanes sp. SE50/110]ATO83295.1 diacylglycerol kinase [Actinoplanes sp. SE50]SLM00702.1 diacylglycerol kinase [Actinoplanes sp. SE50/110]